MRSVTTLLCFLFCSLASAEDVGKSEEKIVQPDLKEVAVSGPYCGIYALYAVLDSFGIEPDIEELLVKDYVGSFQGSSNYELIQAAEKYGLYGKTYGNLTWQELESSESPMILHFRSTYADTQFNHWVAYFGVDGGKARILDLPHRMVTIPFAELLAKWDGTAIEISRLPITSNVMAASRGNYLLTILFILGGLLTVKTLYWRRDKEAFAAPTFFQKIKKGAVQTAMLLAVLFTSGILYHALASVGFLKNPSAVAEVTRRYYSVDIPEIGMAEMERAVKEKAIPLFDARYGRDYHHGTIASAKNMPINSSLTERQGILGELPKSQRMIVFCQSSSCGYADEVARFLKFNGYENVVIYRGGYREWNQKHGSAE